jgi:hypothetical protein
MLVLLKTETGFSKTFSVNKENYDLLQNVELPLETTTVKERERLLFKDKSPKM